MKRREFIAWLAGAAAWPVGAHGQQPERMRLVGVLMGSTDNAEARSRITAFLQALQELGWTEGRTVQIDLRWGGRSSESIAAQARELTQLKPDVIFAGPTATKGDPHYPDRVRDGFRPARTGLCPKPGAPKRQHHRFQ